MFAKLVNGDGTGVPCECSDPGCPAGGHKHPEGPYCDRRVRVVLFRIDMEDAMVRMCRACAEDALNSGLFRLGVAY